VKYCICRSLSLYLYSYCSLNIPRSISFTFLAFNHRTIFFVTTLKKRVRVSAYYMKSLSNKNIFSEYLNTITLSWNRVSLTLAAIGMRAISLRAKSCGDELNQRFSICKVFAFPSKDCWYKYSSSSNNWKAIGKVFKE